MPAAEREELEGTLRKEGIGGGGGGPLDVAAEFGTGRRPDIWFSGKLLGTEACDAEPTDEPASRSGRSMADSQYEECAAQVRNVGRRAGGEIDRWGSRWNFMTICRCLKDEPFQKTSVAVSAFVF